ncbi:MAG: hypothetical protein NDI69_06120 [Bacteriovoracaceae bacterium]|nr:hypothetical protein [Bacteriovoracaceae bacterium]
MIFRKLGKLNLDRSHLLIVGALGFLATALIFHKNSKRPEIVVTKQDSAVNINSIFLQMFATGNKRLIADLLWIQTLIESDLEFYRGQPLNNWMYLRFKSISILDPLFYENYLYGGQYLSIVKDDPEAAALIMDKGLKYYPNDYGLNFNQAFNYYFELGNNEKGLQHFERIKDHPEAPFYLTSLIIKLKHELVGDKNVTITLLKETYDKTRDRILRSKLASDIYALKAMIDLECLNSGKTNCDQLDAEGNPYLFSSGSYKAKKIFKPYKIFRHSK